MQLKIFSVLILICALCFNAYSQKTADDAAKSGLNVGAKMPAFKLIDANGKTVESKDLLKQGSLVVVAKFAEKYFANQGGGRKCRRHFG